MWLQPSSRFLRQLRFQPRFQLRFLLAATLPGQDVDTFHLGNGYAYSYSLTVIRNGCSDPHIDKNRIKPNKCVCHMRHRLLPNWNPACTPPSPLLDWRRGCGILICAAELPKIHRSCIILAVCGVICGGHKKQHKLPCAIIAGTDNGDGIRRNPVGVGWGATGWSYGHVAMSWLIAFNGWVRERTRERCN